MDHPSIASPDDGLYGPGSQAWRLSREAVLLLVAGPRSLLLQLAHPLVAEGVDQHSTFRIDPWGRLQATVRSYLTVVYGTADEARAEIRRLNGLHRSIEGPVRDPVARGRHGSTYRARDPELSLWVHATLVDSTLVGHEAVVGPVGRADRARYYGETIPIGRALGIPDRLLPPDLDRFEAYVERMLAPGGPIEVTPTARELARTVLHPPLEPLARRGPLAERLGWLAPLAGPLFRAVPPPAYDWTLWPAIALLPERVRAGFGIRWTGLERATAAWLTA
ncbi:MAG TPA: oxygenase MpaB family protein, partial [Candidatus Limnocylindrales bacterium]|nr:oxygenase MpaB family protein [Candidatus Limnocylindrales bacterium]